MPPADEISDPFANADDECLADACPHCGDADCFECADETDDGIDVEDDDNEESECL